MKKTDLPGKKGIIISLIVLAILTPVMGLSAMFLGTENILTTMMLMIAAVLILRAGIREKPALVFVQVLIMNIGCGIAASAVHINVWLGLAVNIAVLFLQTSVMFRDKGMQVFFPFHLSYIYMMACSPVSFGEIGPRMILLVLGALLCFGAQAISWKKLTKSGTVSREEPAPTAICGEETSPAYPDYGIRKLFDVHSVRFSFALRRTIGVTAAWFLVTCFDIEYGKWLILSVNSIITPYLPAAAEKLRKRFAGCTAGAVIFFFAIAVTGNVGIHIAILAVAMYVSILFYSRYAIRYCCTTIISLSVAALCDPETMTFAVEKPAFVLIGGMAALLINRLILPQREE